MLTGCGEFAPTDRVDTVAAHPNRLHQLLRQCRDDRAKLGDAVCNSASEAFRQRFMGNGKAPYTPRREGRVLVIVTSLAAILGVLQSSCGRRRRNPRPIKRIVLMRRSALTFASMLGTLLLLEILLPAS